MKQANLYNVRIIQHSDTCWAVVSDRTVKPLRRVAHLYTKTAEEAEEIRLRFEAKYNKEDTKS